jgi:FkbM family methyltransferase
MFNIFQLIPPAPIRVIDVGAMEVGKDVYAPLVQAGVASVLGFECVKAECDKLNAAGKASHTYLPYAIGDGRERLFHECNFPMTSSFYEPNTELLSKFQNLVNLTQVVRTETMQTHRLDDIPEAADADFMKLDVQGAEVDVLNGAEKMLETVTVIHTEVEFVPMYKGQPLFAEVDQRLRQAGFSLLKIAAIAGRAFQPVIANNDPNQMVSQMLWAEVVYVKDFMALDRLSPEKLLRMAVVLHVVYEAFDIVHHILVTHDGKTGRNLAPVYLARVTAKA